jgi:hypothetical protein
MAFATEEDGKMETLQDKIVELLQDEAFINPNKCEYELADKIEKLLITDKEPVADVLCNVGLVGPTVKLDEVLDFINNYCKLHPTTDGAVFEAGFRQAGQCLIRELKIKYRKAD